jgi:hypothetical protein
MTLIGLQASATSWKTRSKNVMSSKRIKQRPMSTLGAIARPETDCHETRPWQASRVGFIATFQIVDQGELSVSTPVNPGPDDPGPLPPIPPFEEPDPPQEPVSPVKEPEPDRLPDEVPLPNPDENPDPPQRVGLF